MIPPNFVVILIIIVVNVGKIVVILIKIVVILPENGVISYFKEALITSNSVFTLLYAGIKLKRCLGSYSEGIYAIMKVKWGCTDD